MTTLITIMLLVLLTAVVVGPLIYSSYQKRFRKLKEYERALKMVPLLIHLPPPSDDTQANGRDIRDLTDENISKANIIYNIIASTLQKGFKAKFYGQKHFAFEVVGSHGFVYFYAAVPVTMVDVVKQAVVSAYPAARLEEAAEHNIFSDVGKLTAVTGGELHLKSSFAYPIATYQDLKRDAMQSLLNALSTLEKEDGAGIQLLMRPADPAWRKEASAIASKKRKGKENKSGIDMVGSGLRSFIGAFSAPPGEKDGDKDKGNDLSAMEQQVLDSIDEKTKHPGYEVLIRVVASSNVAGRADGILRNMVATFSLFDAPGKNGFSYTPAKDTSEFVTSYIMRFFPHPKKKDILNSTELATVFHFPDQRSIPTSQVTRQESKQVDAPRNMPDTGLLLGYNVFRNNQKPIRLGLVDRQRHMYAVGQTGTGKSTFLENLALQDMINGDGFAFIDPHGDTAEKLLSMVPKERTEDVVYFCPAEMDYPMGLNLFEFDSPDQKDFLIQETLNMLQKLYDPTHQGIMGPRYEHIFRNCALAVMADPAGGTFVDIPNLFRDPQYLKKKLQHVTDQTVLDFWLKEYPASQRSNDAGEVTSWFVSKFGAFLSNTMMRNIIGQTKSAFNLRDIMDNKKILIVNLSKGRTGDLNSKLLGMIFVMKFGAAAMSRANIPENQRQDFCLYVDEFQNFSTDSFATIMSEARKYRLNLIVANQFTTQLTPEIRDAVFGNMGTIVSFRVGQQDVESLAKYFQPLFDENDLLRVPSYNAIVRTLIGGVPTNPFSMMTLPPLGNPNPKLADALKQLSAAKYGHPKDEIEKAIFKRMAAPPARPAFGQAGAPGGMPGGAGMAGAPAGYGAPGGAPVRPAAPAGWGSANVTAPGAAPGAIGARAGQYNNGPGSLADRGGVMPAGGGYGQQPVGAGMNGNGFGARQGVGAPAGYPPAASQPGYGAQPTYAQQRQYMQSGGAPGGMPNGIGQPGQPLTQYPNPQAGRQVQTAAPGQALSPTGMPISQAQPSFLDDWLKTRRVAQPASSVVADDSQEISKLGPVGEAVANAGGAAPTTVIDATKDGPAGGPAPAATAEAGAEAPTAVTIQAPASPPHVIGQEGGGDNQDGGKSKKKKKKRKRGEKTPEELAAEAEAEEAEIAKLLAAKKREKEQGGPDAKISEELSQLGGHTTLGTAPVADNKADKDAQRVERIEKKVDDITEAPTVELKRHEVKKEAPKTYYAPGAERLSTKRGSGGAVVTTGDEGIEEVEEGKLPVEVPQIEIDENGQLKPIGGSDAAPGAKPEEMPAQKPAAASAATPASAPAAAPSPDKKPQ